MNKFSVILAITILSITNYCTGSVKGLIPEAEGIVSAGLKSSDGQIRAAAIEVVAEGQKIDMVKEVVFLLDDPQISVRFSAAVAIGDLQYGESKEKLEKMLKDPDLNVAVAAAYSLYRLGEKKYLELIEDSAKSDDQTVKANVSMLLGKLQNKHSLPILQKLKDSLDSSDVVALNSTESIARIQPDDQIYKKIWTMLISVSADKRYMGIHAMGAFGGAKGAGAILTLLDDDITEVRLAAAEQLGSLGDNSGQTVVLEYLTSPQESEKGFAERCNAIAAFAIGQIGGEPLKAHLPKLLKNESPFVRLAASKSIFILDKRR